MNNKPVVLIVDDQPQNIELLEAFLVPEGYEIINAASGEEALARCPGNKIDLVLLDVMMPGMNGFEVCRMLKTNPETAAIPVLLVTSLQQRENRINGMMAGANDFISKPVDKEDLLLRVRNAVYAKTLYDEVQSNYDKLKKMERLRDNLMHMIVYDLRAPLTDMSGYMQLIPRESMDPKHAAYLDKSLSSARALAEMIDSLLDVSRFEDGKMPVNKASVDIRILIQEVVESMGQGKGKSEIIFESPGYPVMIECDSDIVRRIFVNLLGNALKFSPAYEMIKITIDDTEGGIKVSITDKGYGIAPEYYQKIFERFEQIEMQKQHQMHSTGLGLTFCKLAVEAHGGKIGVVSESGVGSTFWFTLPV